MTKENVKKYVKEHKAEIAKGCLNLALFGVWCWSVTTVVKDMKSFDKYWKMASKDAKVYLPAYGEELTQLLEPFKGVVDGNGNYIDVTGALLFGNVVEQ